MASLFKPTYTLPIPAGQPKQEPMRATGTDPRPVVQRTPNTLPEPAKATRQGTPREPQAASRPDAAAAIDDGACTKLVQEDDRERLALIPFERE